MTISDASELAEDCFHLFLDAGYNGLIDDAMSFIGKDEERRNYLTKHMLNMNSWYNELNIDFSTEELEKYFQSAPHDIQLGWIIYIHHRVIMLLQNLEQDTIIDFPTELSTIAKLICDSAALYRRLGN